ncbi:MAG: glutamate racemase [Oscillospiraceae bacterium]|nr:glutamate racemase [Oscillospiraceae bacterium]MBQ1768286.1 glutamate racemase [Oscillospiraceae bacterium]MBQ2057536.1 glutamate racemase [Oscillospiraceae bacterium]MBQ2230893.1 glutamate racemase [Oscillospiraceae bacterium]MBQ3952306.1 glutamate racemase [Oscillospiraceae bacterium]
MDKRPIGVFDSGLGGLTAVKMLSRVLPGEDIIYFGDTGRVPYGGRSRETIMKYAGEDIAFLRSFDIKAVLAACGTVSTNGLETVAESSDVPVWGVVGAAARAAVKATKNGRIGIIGTKASIRSGAYDRAIQELLPGAFIEKKACPLFVPLVEAGKTDRLDPVLRLVAEEYLLPMKRTGIDTLILGCTHYPIIAAAIGDVLGPGVELIDTGAASAAEIAAYLTENGLVNDEGGMRRYFVSDSPESFSEAARLFLGGDLMGEVTKVSLEEMVKRGGEGRL